MQPSSHSIRLEGVAHEANRYKVIRLDGSGDPALATDSTAQQPCGVIDGGDQYNDDAASVIVHGPARALVGSAGLAVGFQWLTCDAASKIKAATPGTDAILGYAFVGAALTEDQAVDLIVSPKPIDIDT